MDDKLIKRISRDHISISESCFNDEKNLENNQEDMNVDVSIKKTILVMITQQQNSTPIVTKKNQAESLSEVEKAKIKKWLSRKEQLLSGVKVKKKIQWKSSTINGSSNIEYANSAFRETVFKSKKEDQK